jgi:hypothetical protein
MNFVVLLLLGQVALADRVPLTQQKNPTGSSQKRAAMKNRLQKVNDANHSAETTVSKSTGEGLFQDTLRSFKDQMRH